MAFADWQKNCNSLVSGGDSGSGGGRGSDSSKSIGSGGGDGDNGSGTSHDPLTFTGLL